MKRTPMPARVVPLAPGGPLARSTGLSRGTGFRPPLAVVERDGAVVLAPREWQRRSKDTGPSAATRKLVLERDGHACVCCGRTVLGQPYSLQHRKRRSQGGDNSPCNLITVLGTGTTLCHERIDSRRDPEDEAKGYTVRSWGDPALIPVMVFSGHGSGVLAWLTPEGGYAYEAPGGAP